jgi:protein SCO1/2
VVAIGVALLMARPTLAKPLAPAQVRSPLLSQVGFDQNLNAQLPLDLAFRDEAGRTVTLGEYFGKRPVIVNLVYYECPMLCTLELTELARSLKPVAFNPGQEFEIVTVSIDPGEQPALAAAKKHRYLELYGRKGAEVGWHFLTGDESSIKRLAQTVGFRYAYDPTSDQYAHPAGIIMATPQGRISRYFYGLNYPARDLRLGLIEASAGKIGAPIDRLLLLCFHYDPNTGRYNFAIMSVLRILGTGTVLGLGTFMFVMYRRDRRRAVAGALDIA